VALVSPVRAVQMAGLLGEATGSGLVEEVTGALESRVRVVRHLGVCGTVDGDSPVGGDRQAVRVESLVVDGRAPLENTERAVARGRRGADGVERAAREEVTGLGVDGEANHRNRNLPREGDIGRG